MIVPSSSQNHHHADIAAPRKKAMAIPDDVPTDDESVSDSDGDNDSDSSSYDACDELFKHGDYLRKLRQLEQEDEALREKERQEHPQQDDDDNDDDGSDTTTLDYKRYLTKQEDMYDDYKHVNYQHIDFGIIDAAGVVCGSESEKDSSTNAHQTPLVIEQDRSLGKGGFIWDAGVILADSVLRMEQKETEWLDMGRGDNTQKKTTKIVELGAGTGVTSLIIAKACPQATVHLTDLPLLMPLLSKNCEQCPGQATCGVLEWGKPVLTGENAAAPYDIILAADVVAGIYDSSGLAKTIYDLSHEKTVVYLAYRERLTGLIERFESHMHELFRKVEKMDSDSSNHSPNVFIMRVSGKRVYTTNNNSTDE